MTDAKDQSPAFRLILPQEMTTPVLFASPHSGRDYPAEMLARSVLDLRRLRSSEDAFVDDLLARAPAAGAALLAARLPRAWVDLNRADDELDPALIEGLSRSVRGPRVLAGLGVIPRVVSGGRAIYSGKIAQAEAEARLATCWRPYHAALGGLIADVRARFGRVLLLDVHSMPSEAVSQSGARPPDIVLGDRFSVSARRETTGAVEAVFLRAGLRVARNAPFAGAYVTQHYGRPSDGIEVIQIEINRALYMDEQQICRSDRYPAFAETMGRVVEALAALGRDAHWLRGRHGSGGALAAE